MSRIIAMTNVELYRKNNSFQKRDAMQMFMDHGHRITWKKNASVIDLGSGDGFVTVNIVQKQLPSDFKRLVGVDISKEMVYHSKKEYSEDNDKVLFSLLDIGGEIPDEYKGAFHHAFSLHVLHWVFDQEKVFENIYDMLKANGDCLLTFIASSPVYNVWRSMAQVDKWTLRSKGVLDRVIPRYHDLQEPDKEVRRIMTEVGFKEVHVELNQSPYIYKDLNQFKRFAQSINPFSLTGELLEEFGDEFVDIAFKLELLERVEEDEEAVMMEHNRITAYGRKSG